MNNVCVECRKKLKYGKKYCSYKCMYSLDPAKRFLDKVKKTNYCWEWTAYKSNLGYGRFSLNGKTVKAHRASLMLLKNMEIDGYHVLHKCDNPSCVKPDHLYLGDDQDNANDKINRGRQIKGDKCSLTKFSFKKIKEMRAEFINGNLSKNEIQSKYGISRRHLNDILNFKWRKDK